MLIVIIFGAILVILLCLVGIIGSIIPAIPGPPLNYIALVIMRFITPQYISMKLLIITGIITLIVSIIDYFAPAWLTKMGGGSKAAIRGSLLGTIAGLFFFQPWGLILGPFLGAFLGEMSECSDTHRAFRVGFYAFLSFLLGTGIKLIASIVMTWYAWAAIIRGTIAYYN